MNNTDIEEIIEEANIKSTNNVRKEFKLRIFWLLIPIIVVIIISIINNIPADIENIKDSVVMIEVYDENGKKLSQGSGFCAIKSNYIITNFHVIDGGYSIKIISDNKETYDTEDILIFNKEEDLAILKVNTNFSTLNISKNNKLKAGDSVVAIGSPQGELNTVSTGIVSNADEEGIIRISAPISHGSSGGVLLDKKMNAIGITSSGYDEAQNLNFAIKVEKLNQLYEYYQNNKENVTIWDDRIRSLYTYYLFYSKEDEMGLLDRCFENNNIIPDTINDFYQMTNPMAIIKSMNAEDNWTDEEKYYIAEMYDLLLKYEPSMKEQIHDSEVVDNSEEWKPAQLIFELEILTRCQLAELMIEMDKMQKDEYFSYIDSMDLDIPEKVVLLISVAGYRADELDNGDIDKMIKWIDGNENFDYDKTIGILRNLGLNVNYDTGDIWW